MTNSLTKNAKGMCVTDVYNLFDLNIGVQYLVIPHPSFSLRLPLMNTPITFYKMFVGFLLFHLMIVVFLLMSRKKQPH